MAKLPFRSKAKANHDQTPSGAATPSRPQTQSATQPCLPPPPPSRNDRDKNEMSKKRASEGDVSKDAQSKKQKNVVPENSPTDPITSTFGGIALRNYTELDLNTHQGRDDEEEEVALKAGIGDVFYHGLRVLNLKNSLIKDQEKSLKRLATEIGNLNLKMCEARKKADEEAKILKEDAEKARAELEQVKKDFMRIVRVIEGELSSTQGELESLKASFGKACEEHYDNGYLDYLHSFLAADPEYDWSVKFPLSTPAFMANF